MATIYLAAARCTAPSCEGSLTLGGGKYWNLLVLILSISFPIGCASTQGTAFDRQILLELEEKNARLEAEVTRLREEKLRSDRKSDCSAGRLETASSDPEEGPENLPVVEMHPATSQNELEAGGAVIRPAEPLPEQEPIDDTTRPVLTVRGKHEAWVYHRPVTDEDRKAKSEPDSQPQKPQQESN